MILTTFFTKKDGSRKVKLELSRYFTVDLSVRTNLDEFMADIKAVAVCDKVRFLRISILFYLSVALLCFISFYFMHRFWTGNCFPFI